MDYVGFQNIMGKPKSNEVKEGAKGVLRGGELKAMAAQLGEGWKLVAESHLEREFKFKDFRQALAYTNKVGELAESVGHHPDILLGWGMVRLTLRTHSKNGLTAEDFALAGRIDELG